MLYVEVDLYKHSPTLQQLTRAGTAYAPHGFRQNQSHFGLSSAICPRPTQTFEATRNWYWVYDLLEEEVDGIKLYHPAKPRLIGGLNRA